MPEMTFLEAFWEVLKNGGQALDVEQQSLIEILPHQKNLKFSSQKFGVAEDLSPNRVRADMNSVIDASHLCNYIDNSIDASSRSELILSSNDNMQV